MNNTYKSILEEVCVRTLAAESLESDAQLFALLRQLAYTTGDLPAVTDVDNAVLQIVEKCRNEKGDAEANRFMSIYDYSSAGATLGSDFAAAVSNGDTSFAEAVYAKAKRLSEQLAERRELRDAFGALFRQFSAVS